MLHELLFVHEYRIAKRAVAAPERVLYLGLLFGAAAFPQVVFQINQLFAHCRYRVDDVLFPAAQRDLVADLIKVA